MLKMSLLKNLKPVCGSLASSLCDTTPYLSHYTVHCTVYSRVEWFSTFCDFRKATRFCRSGVFFLVQYQNIIEFRSTHARLSFHFQKVTGTLQVKIFLKICRNLHYMYIKEQLPKWKFEIKTVLILFFIFQKWAKRCFI